MKCTECAEARRFSDGAVYCVQYGMIIREKHECSLPGAHEKTADVEPVSGTAQEAEKGTVYEL